MKNKITKIALILLIIMTVITLGSLVMVIIQAVETGFSTTVVKEIADILVGELIVFLLYLGMKHDACKQ